jgi:hypothetical protein
MKNLLLLSLLVLLFSCKTNHQSNNVFYQHFEYAIDVYGDSIFNHFPEKMSVNPNKNKNIANATFRLKTDHTTFTDSNNFRPIFLLYGEKLKNERKLNYKIEQLEQENATQIDINNSSCFYIFDFETKDNQKYVYPFFAKIKDNQSMSLGQTTARFILDFNREENVHKKYPLPLLNDTIVTLNNQWEYILSKNLTHYIINQRNAFSWNDTISNNYSEFDCLPLNWEHGFSQGYSVSKKDRYILYWVLIW